MAELTLLMPVHNEVESIEQIIKKYHAIISKKNECEILICEDGSTDGTKELLKKLQKEMNLKLVLGDERKGYPKAAKDALSVVKTPLVFFIDSDDQYNPENFWDGIKYIPEYDIVIGKRRVQKEKFYRIMLTRGFNFLLRAIFHIPTHDADCGFRIIKKEVIDKVINDVHCLPYSFTAEFLVRAQHSGFKIKEIEIDHFERGFGESKVYPISKLSKIILAQLAGLIELKKELSKKKKANLES